MRAQAIFALPRWVVELFSLTERNEFFLGGVCVCVNGALIRAVCYSTKPTGTDFDLGAIGWGLLRESRQ